MDFLIDGKFFSNDLVDGIAGNFLEGGRKRADKIEQRRFKINFLGVRDQFLGRGRIDLPRKKVLPGGLAHL